MGEYSKRIGERGEEIVVDFLRLIGWNDIQRNFDIDSVDPVRQGIPPPPSANTCQTTKPLPVLWSLKLSFEQEEAFAFQVAKASLSWIFAAQLSSSWQPPLSFKPNQFCKAYSLRDRNTEYTSFDRA